MRGDTIEISGIPAFVVAENVTFLNTEQVIDFYKNSEIVEWEMTHYPILYGLLGGSIETRRYVGRRRHGMPKFF
jgi:hypothetical protein